MKAVNIVMIACVAFMLQSCTKENKPRMSSGLSWQIRVMNLLVYDMERKSWLGDFSEESYNAWLSQQEYLLEGVGGPAPATIKVSFGDIHTLDPGKARWQELELVVTWYDSDGVLQTSSGIFDFLILKRNQDWRSVFDVVFSTDSVILLDERDNLIQFIAKGGPRTGSVAFGNVDEAKRKEIVNKFDRLNTELKIHRERESVTILDHAYNRKYIFRYPKEQALYGSVEVTPISD